MIKKADELRIDDLNLSKRTKAYLADNFNSVEDIVMAGRTAAYANDESRKWKTELTRALTENGFVRPKDELARFFAYATFYYALTGNKANDVPIDIDRMSNELYESDVEIQITKDEAEAIDSFIWGRLGDIQAKVVVLYYGIDRGRLCNYDTAVYGAPHEYASKPYSFDAIAASLGDGYTREKVRQCLSHSLRRLRRINSSRGFREWLSNPVKEPARVEPTDEISKLDLALRSWNCLRRAGITSVGDILAIERWDGVRNIGRMMLVDIEVAMQKAGYADFHILPDDLSKLNLTSHSQTCLRRAGITSIESILAIERWDRVRNLGSRGAADIEAAMRKAGYADFRIELQL